MEEHYTAASMDRIMQQMHPNNITFHFAITLSYCERKVHDMKSVFVPASLKPLTLQFCF